MSACSATAPTVSKPSLNKVSHGMSETELVNCVDKHRSRLLRIAGRYVGRELAEDMLQEAYLKAWKSRESFQGRSSLSTWLTRIIINECLIHLRKQKSRSKCINDLRQESFACGGTCEGNGLLHVLRQETLTQLCQAISRLDRRRRKAVLQAILGHSLVESIGPEKIKIPSMKSRRRRAHLSIQRRLPGLVKDLHDLLFVENHYRSEAEHCVDFSRLEQAS